MGERELGELRGADEKLIPHFDRNDKGNYNNFFQNLQEEITARCSAEPRLLLVTA